MSIVMVSDLKTLDGGLSEQSETYKSDVKCFKIVENFNAHCPKCA